jgi:hypothetical protein
MMTKSEEWRPTHHPNYEVSNLGRVRSYAKRGWQGGREEVPRILKPVFPKGRTTRYASVQMGKGKMRPIHQLVAEAFLGPCPAGQEVMHRDDSGRNPRLDNLRYGTHKENSADMMQKGRAASHRGEDNGRARLTTSQVIEIRQALADAPLCPKRNARVVGFLDKLAARYGVSKNTIEGIGLRHGWAHV